MEKNRKKIIFAVASFAALSLIAKAKKRDYYYENEKEQKNPFESKRVTFVQDEGFDMNADGERGYMQITGESEPVKTAYVDCIKRIFDIILSFCGIVILSPVFAILSLAIVVDDPGPVLFIQKRVGKDKAFFKLHKFRSMKMSTPHETPTHMLGNPDQYITNVGRFIRKYSLDELPQIWDIFVGTMSVIGPRPALWNQDMLVSERDKYSANDIYPGLTGWAQIHGRDELSIAEKAKADGEYVAAVRKGIWSGIKMDVTCFIQTIASVLKSEGVVEGSASKDN